MKRSAPPWNGSAFVGNGPNNGLPVQTPNTSEKKAPRPADRPDQSPYRLGDWLSRRNLVEPPYPAAPARLVAGWTALASGRASPDQNRSDAKSAGLLWPAGAPLSPSGGSLAGGVVAALCRGSSVECHHHTVPGLVLRQVAGDGQTGTGL